jgi:hypothetical protein
MNKENFKNELLKRFKTRNPNSSQTSFEKASDDIVDIINEIIQDNKIEITDDYKDELLTYLKPIISELVLSSVRKDISDKIRDSFK